MGFWMSMDIYEYLWVLMGVYGFLVIYGYYIETLKILSIF